MRGMGDTTAYLRRGIREIICLALFFFTFLACEYLLDVRMAEFVSPNEVVIYESLVIGASVIGFFVRPILYYGTADDFLDRYAALPWSGYDELDT